MENWLNAQPDSPEALIFKTITKAVQVMGVDRDHFSSLAAEFIINNSGEELTDLQKNAIHTAARSIYVQDVYALAQGLNAILTFSWADFGIKYMPEGSAMTADQRLGFIHGIYAFSAIRISQFCSEMGVLLTKPYQNPSIPAV